VGGGGRGLVVRTGQDPMVSEYTREIRKQNETYHEITGYADGDRGTRVPGSVPEMSSTRLHAVQRESGKTSTDRNNAVGWETCVTKETRHHRARDRTQSSEESKHGGPPKEKGTGLMSAQRSGVRMALRAWTNERNSCKVRGLTTQGGKTDILQLRNR